MSTKYLDKTGLEHIGEAVDTAKHKTYSITAADSNLSLENTTKGYPLDIELNGNISQDKYSGKNLINVKDGNYTYSTTHTWVVRNGIVDLTINSMAVQGGCLLLTNGTTQQWSAGVDSNITPNGGTYTISVNRTGTITASTTNNPGLYLYLYIYKEGGTSRSVNIVLDKTSTSATTTHTITLDNDEHIGEATLYSQFIECTNIKIEVQIESGSTATSYEPYVGKKSSPNTDYPQPINTVTGNQSMKIYGKNLFNVNGNYTWVGNNTASSVNNNVLKVTGDWFVGMIIEVKKNTDYYVSADRNIITSSSKTGTISIYQTDESIAVAFRESGNFTFNSGNNAQLYINFNSGIGTSGEVEFSNIQIEEGTTATPFDSYATDYNFNLGKNLFDKTNNIVNGAYISSTGTVMTNDPDLSYQDAYIKVTPNTIYTISSNENITYRIAQYDASKTFIYRYVSSDSTNYQFTTRPNCYYIKMAGVSTTAIDSIQIEKGSKATTYSSYFTPIELCKIGTYQDYIYKNNDKWYKKAYIGKVILNGSETIKYIDTVNSNHAFYIQVSNVKAFGTFNEDLCIYSDRLEWCNMNAIYNETEGITPSNGNSYYYTSSIGLYADATKSMTVEQFKTWLSTNNITVYYILDTPTDTEITDTTLISQLESLKDATTFENTTHIEVSSDDAPAIVKATYNKAHFLNTLDKSELKDEIKALAENTSEILGDINTALESIVTVGGGS